ncbi:unnamed protein product, partial [Laminaria digitata]
GLSLASKQAICAQASKQAFLFFFFCPRLILAFIVHATNSCNAAASCRSKNNCFLPRPRLALGMDVSASWPPLCIGQRSRVLLALTRVGGRPDDSASSYLQHLQGVCRAYLPPLSST